ncbi:hypothetical protein D3C84_1168450 [compost metagenome]
MPQHELGQGCLGTLDDAVAQLCFTEPLALGPGVEVALPLGLGHHAASLDLFHAPTVSKIAAACASASVTASGMAIQPTPTK